MAKNKENKRYFLFLFIFLVIFLSAIRVMAVPVGPSQIVSISNETIGATGGVIQNQTQGGGYIYTVIINGTTQNMKWKAYVGNVTGKLALQDASGSTIYDWTLTATIAGEIYASRVNSVSWANINCTWAGTGNKNNTNRTVEEQENYRLNHTSANDNISKTFDGLDNAALQVGNVNLPANYCYTTNPYVNNATQSTQFEEVLLYDNATDAYSGNLVYANIIENHVAGFDSQLYDFQMIVPENAVSGTILSTAYYFYVELS